MTSHHRFRTPMDWWFLLVWAGQLLLPGNHRFTSHALSANSEPTLPRRPIGRVNQLERRKIDRQPDGKFYAQPNLNVHADRKFREKLSDLYRDLLPEDGVVLDMMSSHVSHLPMPELKLSRVDVHGMNEEELRANEARMATGGTYCVRDLNKNPSLLGIGTTGEYDAVLCCVGVQYLEEPEAVFAEVGRILKPNTGVAIVSFTNRFFYQKALTGWIERGMGERARLVKDFFRAAGGFDPITIEGDGTSPMVQLLSLGGLGGDPYVAVVARRNGEP